MDILWNKGNIFTLFSQRGFHLKWKQIELPQDNLPLPAWWYAPNISTTPYRWDAFHSFILLDLFSMFRLNSFICETTYAFLRCAEDAKWIKKKSQVCSNPRKCLGAGEAFFKLIFIKYYFVAITKNI